MKLKPIIPLKKGPSPQSPSITINGSGTLTINTAAVERYGFKEGSHIAILQDEDKPNDFYLIETKDANFPKLKKAGKVSLKTGYSAAKEAIDTHFGIENKAIRLNLAGQVKTELGTAIVLITTSLKDLAHAKAQ
ncbi:hypothetical protein [Mariniradius saccharolyticus]|nr:hypothetical protein [Mariniradius saccharolyticus]